MFPRPLMRGGGEAHGRSHARPAAGDARVHSPQAGGHSHAARLLPVLDGEEEDDTALGRIFGEGLRHPMMHVLRYSNRGNLK